MAGKKVLMVREMKALACALLRCECVETMLRRVVGVRLWVLLPTLSSNSTVFVKNAPPVTIQATS